jgi:TolB protein
MERNELPLGQVTVLLVGLAVLLLTLVSLPSPAANRLLFLSDREGDWNIYALDVDTLTTQKLTHEPVTDCCPVWSRDGRQIAFASYHEEEYAYKIYLMNANGSSLRVLSAGAVDDMPYSWSPDNQHLAFVRRVVNGALTRIWISDVKTGSAHLLTQQLNTSEFTAQWSPDGQYILFQGSSNSDEELYRIDTDGQNLLQLTDNRVYDGRAVWSPDSSQIAFESDHNLNVEIYVMNADGSNQRRLTTSPGYDGFPAWSPDGEKILFVSSTDPHGSSDLFVINADGSNLTQITHTLSDESEFAWSPDGESIAFSSNRLSNWDIYLVNADGSNERRLTADKAYDYYPVWQP